MATCSHCGGDLPAEAVFCPSCGRRTDLPAAESDDGPVDLQYAEPRYFGLGPPIFVFSLGVALLALGVILIVAGSVALGVIAIILAVCLLPTFLAGARRWPETPIARAGISTADRVRDEADVAVTSISTWSRAGREVVRLRKDQFRLRRDRDAKIRELGRSVYDEDGRADELKATAKELDDKIAANDRALQRTVKGARRRVKKDRAAVVATQVIPSGALEEDAAQPAAGEGRGPDPKDDEADAADVESRS